MKTTMQILNIGFGAMEGTPWAKAEVLDENVEYVNSDGRIFKGSKTAKLNFSSDNGQALGQRFEKEDFPANFEVDVDMSIVGGKTQLKIVNFKSNIK